MRVDVLVVGGGPAGLAAATELRRLGATVTVAEREREPGGIPRHTEHIGYGLRDQHRIATGPRYAAGLVERATRAGVDLRTSTTVLTLDSTAAVLATPSGPVEVDAAAVVLATGVRERPRSARLVPGDRPAGVLTTGALQQFAAARQRVGRRAVVVGAEHVSFSAILTLHHVGCEVAAMVTPLPRHQTYEPLRIATATRHRVPIRTGVQVDEIIGRRRVEAVALSDGSRIECDTVVFTGDWIPDYELARRAGLEMVAGSRAPAVDARFRTSRRGLFAIGNLVHPAETADVCALDGRAVAASVREWLEGEMSWPDAVAPITVDAPIIWAAHTARGITLRVDEFVRGCLVLESDRRTVWTSRSRHLVPNRSITIPRPDAGPATTLHVRFLGHGRARET
jgi:thioredoxin reductase